MSDSRDRSKQGTDKFLGCKICGTVPIRARGMCATCYQAERRAGTLGEHPSDRMYEPSYAEDTIRQIVEIHGVDFLDNVLRTIMNPGWQGHDRGVLGVKIWE